MIVMGNLSMGDVIINMLCIHPRATQNWHLEELVLFAILRIGGSV